MFRSLDEGFTLVEVMVALVLLTVVMVAALPAFLGMLRSTVTSKKDAQSKNLTQERLEQIRDLRFHVDRQNGPFLDLLDIYYTNAPTAPVTTPVNAGGTALTGIFVNSGTPGVGEPSLPFYRTTTGALPGAADFSQVIDAQFLAPDGTAIPASRFQSNYDSQMVGKDQPPSIVLGITVITSWNDRGRVQTYRTYTRVTDGRPQLPVIQSQARAVAVDVTSSASDGTTLELQGGVSSADGSQSSGSSVSGYATGALATRTGRTAVSGLASQFNLPTQAVSSTGSSGPNNGSGCGWYGFASTGVSDATGDVSTGLPKSPLDVDASVPPRMMSGYIVNNGGGGCGQLSYDNLVDGGAGRPSFDIVGYEMGGAPYVKVPDAAGSGPSIVGSTYVSSNVLTAIPQKTASGASVAVGQPVVLFPNNPESGGRGLFSARLTSASVDCGSGSATALGSVVGKYVLSAGWWGKRTSDVVARWHTASWIYDSSTGVNPVLAAGSDTWDPANTLLGNGTRLSQLVTSPATLLQPSSVTTGADSGQRGFPNGILSFTSASTLVNESSPGFSAVTVQLGQLSCVADDQR